MPDSDKSRAEIFGEGYEAGLASSRIGSPVGFSERTKSPDHQLTIREIKTIIEVIDFTQPQEKLDQGEVGDRHCHIAIEWLEDVRRWRITAYQFMNAWGEILFEDAVGNYSLKHQKQGVLVTQRGQEKRYKSTDTLIREFDEVLGAKGWTIRIDVFSPARARQNDLDRHPKSKD